MLGWRVLGLGILACVRQSECSSGRRGLAPSFWLLLVPRLSHLGNSSMRCPGLSQVVRIGWWVSPRGGSALADSVWERSASSLTCFPHSRAHVNEGSACESSPLVPTLPASSYVSLHGSQICESSPPVPTQAFLKCELSHLFPPFAGACE